MCEISENHTFGSRYEQTSIIIIKYYCIVINKLNVYDGIWTKPKFISIFELIWEHIFRGKMNSDLVFDSIQEIGKGMKWKRNMIFILSPNKSKSIQFKNCNSMAEQIFCHHHQQETFANHKIMKFFNIFSSVNRLLATKCLNILRESWVIP